MVHIGPEMTVYTMFHMDSDSLETALESRSELAGLMF